MTVPLKPQSAYSCLTLLYLAAEVVHASGVLAVVACGLYLSRQSTEFFSPTVRIQLYAFWNSLTFLLNGLVFMLIGLQLPYVRAEIKEYELRELSLLQHCLVDSCFYCVWHGCSRAHISPI